MYQDNYYKKKITMIHAPLSSRVIKCTFKINDSTMRSVRKVCCTLNLSAAATSSTGSTYPKMSCTPTHTLSHIICRARSMGTKVMKYILATWAEPNAIAARKLRTHPNGTFSYLVQQKRNGTRTHTYKKLEMCDENFTRFWAFCQAQAQCLCARICCAKMPTFLGEKGLEWWTGWAGRSLSDSMVRVVTVIREII